MVGASLDRINLLFDRRFAVRPSWVVLAELFLGIGWLRAVAAKAADSQWWNGGQINEYILDNRPHTIGWYRPIVDSVVLDYRMFWAFVIIAAELAIGVALLTTVRIRTALAAAIFLNVNFVLVGSTNPSIFYLVLQLGLVLWLFETSTKPASTMRWLQVLAVGGVAFALICVPSITTVYPDHLIDDPASVLAAWSACGAIALSVACRRVRREHLRMSAIDLTTPTTSVDRVTESL